MVLLWANRKIGQFTESGFLNFNIVDICMSKTFSTTYFYSSQIIISWLSHSPPGPVILNYNFTVCEHDI